MTNDITDEAIKKARERLESAQILLNAGKYEDSISRSYYAVLDSARAVLATKNEHPKSHSGVIAKFSLLFIKVGKIPLKYRKIIAHIEQRRLEADYNFKVNFTETKTKAIFNDAKDFVDAIIKYLNSRENTK